MPDSDLVEVSPEYLACAEDTEESAWDIQGMVFQDDDMDWCMITGWGVS
jgi:hypothetical protein